MVMTVTRDLDLDASVFLVCATGTPCLIFQSTYLHALRTEFKPVSLLDISYLYNVRVQRITHSKFICVFSFVYFELGKSWIDFDQMYDT
jgi:hypothetical protein